MAFGDKVTGPNRILPTKGGQIHRRPVGAQVPQPAHLAAHEPTGLPASRSDHGPASRGWRASTPTRAPRTLASLRTSPTKDLKNWSRTTEAHASFAWHRQGRPMIGCGSAPENATRAVTVAPARSGQSLISALHYLTHPAGVPRAEILGASMEGRPPALGLEMVGACDPCLAQRSNQTSSMRQPLKMLFTMMVMFLTSGRQQVPPRR